MAHKIIFFDGVCNLCNQSVQLVIKNDSKNQFKFAALQSEAGRRILLQNEFPLEQLTSFVLLENDRIYTKSTAALKVMKSLDGFWRIMYVFIIVPKFIRDGVYSWIAKNRYKWFGKQSTCWLPAPHLNNRFLQ
jgi:predicted DCC family thiol-disulfide oxidoreductase YuxK